MSDPNAEYRKTLLGLEQKVGEGFDKTLIAFSGGALGLTITFIKEIVGKDNIIYTGWILTAWISWAISLFSVIAAYYFGAKAYRHAIKQLDRGTLDSNNPGGIFSDITNGLNLSGGISFMVGGICFVIFAYINLKG